MPSKAYFFFSWNSLAATSSASPKSVPSLKPACPTASAIRSSAARLLGQLGGEAALVADPGGEALLLQHGLERVVDLGALLERLAEGGRTDGRDHELLHVDVGVGVRAAVEDVHHRHRQQVGVGATDVAEQRQPSTHRGGPGDRERDPEDGVGAEVGLVGRAVEVEHRLVDQPLVARVEADDLRLDLVLHGADGLLGALAAVARTAVTQLDGLEGAGGGARGDGRTADGVVVEEHLDLDRGIAPGVQDLAGDDGVDGSQDDCSWVEGNGRTGAQTCWPRSA